MMSEAGRRARDLPRRATNDAQPEFLDGQGEAIAVLVERRARLLVVQRTGWGKSLLFPDHKAVAGP